ncbi:MAG: hypothetical protein ABIF85_00125 [Nanoarchaeota archaeon]
MKLRRYCSVINDSTNIALTNSFYPISRSICVAYFIGPLTAAALIGFFGMREMFLVLGFVMAGFWWMVGE